MSLSQRNLRVDVQTLGMSFDEKDLKKLQAALAKPLRDAADIQLECVLAPQPLASEPAPPDLARIYTVAMQNETEWREPSWRALLILASGTPDAGLRGAMLDVPTLPPRRCAVVFPDVDSAGLHRTCLHEVGHILNLVHPFEIQVGRSLAPTCMNYEAVSQKPLPLDFSQEERDHHLLYPGNPYALLPGGTTFRSEPYWERDLSRDLPRVPVQPADKPPQLRIHLPGTGEAFRVGQPVFLSVTLDRPLGWSAPVWLLDPKAGQLEIYAQRAPGPGMRRQGTGRRFLPIAQRCYSADPGGENGWCRARNLNLAMGAAGPAFVEPGTYEVRAVLRLQGVKDERASRPDSDIVVSGWRRIRVEAPTREEERDLDQLLSPEMGTYWTLGGSQALTAQAGWLDDYVERHQGRSQYINDPIVAHALRCKGLSALRRRQVGDAWRFLKAVQNERCFDAVTRDEMHGLVRDLEETSEPRDRTTATAALATPASAAVSRPGHRWKVVLYMAAEAGNLRGAALNDLHEVQEGLASSISRRDEDVPSIVAQLDEGGPGGKRVLEVTAEALKSLAPKSQTNTGSPHALRAFVSWAHERFPSEHTALILWGHAQGVGFGVRPGVRFLASPDTADFGYDISSSDALTVRELANALRSQRAEASAPGIDFSPSAQALLVALGLATQLPVFKHKGKGAQLANVLATTLAAMRAKDAAPLLDAFKRKALRDELAPAPDGTEGEDAQALNEGLALTLAAFRGAAERMAAATTSPSSTPEIDILGFDSCFMSAAEIACELPRSVKYMLASEGTAPLAGWDYRAVVREIVREPGIDPATLGHRLVAGAAKWQDEPALALLNLGQRRELVDRVKSLVAALEQAVADGAERRRIREALRTAPTSGARQFLDLRELCLMLERTSGDVLVRWAAARTARFLRVGAGNFVEALTPARSGGAARGGVSVYCPIVPNDGDGTAYVDPVVYKRLRFCRKTGWDGLWRDALMRAALATEQLADSAPESNAAATQLGQWILERLRAGALDAALSTSALEGAFEGAPSLRRYHRSGGVKPSSEDKSGGVKPSGDDKSLLLATLLRALDG